MHVSQAIEEFLELPRQLGKIQAFPEMPRQLRKFKLKLNGKTQEANL